MCKGSGSSYICLPILYITELLQLAEWKLACALSGQNKQSLNAEARRNTRIHIHWQGDLRGDCLGILLLELRLNGWKEREGERERRTQDHTSVLMLRPQREMSPFRVQPQRDWRMMGLVEILICLTAASYTTLVFHGLYSEIYPDRDV